MVVPCGIEAIRTTVAVSAGSVVAGTLNQTPGSKWIPTGAVGSVTSLIFCTYGIPLREMSACVKPRLGTVPSGLEKSNVSSVRFNSRTLSSGPCGVFVNCVGERAMFWGRKMVLKPTPVNFPVNAAMAPKSAGMTSGSYPTMTPRWHLAPSESLRHVDGGLDVQGFGHGSFSGQCRVQASGRVLRG